MKYWVLSVGVRDYGAQMEIPNLHCAVNDACLCFQTFRDDLGADGLLLAAPKDIDSKRWPDLAEMTAGEGSRAQIIEGINRIRRRVRAEDIFVFFYSGHGAAQMPSYLIPYGAVFGKPSSYLMYRSLWTELAALPCRGQILFFNCCYGGKALDVARSSAVPNPRETLVGVYAATDDSSVALDRIPSIGGRDEGAVTPFATAICRFIKEEMCQGGPRTLVELAHYLESKGSCSILDHTGAERCVAPVFESFGKGKLLLCRPGHVIDAPARIRGLAKTPIKVPLRVAGGGNLPDRCVWEVYTLNKRLVPAKSSRENDDWVLSFDYPGEHEIRVEIKDSETRETLAARDTTIVVEPSPAVPLGIMKVPLVPCLRGVRYKQRLEISGGVPPYKATVNGAEVPVGADVQIPGVPSCLHVRWREPAHNASISEHSLLIHGVVPVAADSGTPCSSDAGPVVHLLVITVTDVRGSVCRETFRLAVINTQDYCRIPTGDYEIGCARDSESIAAIRSVIQVNQGDLARRFRRSVTQIQQDIAAAEGAIVQGVFEQVLSNNPGSIVKVQEFWIKKYPVTNSDWLRFIKETGSHHIPHDWRKDDNPPYGRGRDRMPVVNITYEAVCAYLKWKGTRLPTAREWECACRGSSATHRLFPWGNRYDRTKCNLRDGSHATGLTPVDHFDAYYDSPTGTRDMIGNAAEWVERRVYWQGRGVFAQGFRGGSFRDHPLFSLPFMDSAEKAVLFGTDERQGVVGQSAFEWVGFRDVVDLDPEPEDSQDLILVEASAVLDGNRQIEVPAFRMARYVVSNLEYLEFVTATGHPPPPGWERVDDGSMPFALFERHLPVVNVTYHDAFCFCMWKSRMLRKIIRLPTSVQWLAAVEAGENRMFPWGQDFNLQYCNSIDSGWGKRVPVFALSEGKSVHGIYNLVGNVFQWITPLEIRGGSWLKACDQLAAPPTRFKAQIAHTDAIEFRRPDVGFRYVENFP